MFKLFIILQGLALLVLHTCLKQFQGDEEKGIPNFFHFADSIQVDIWAHVSWTFKVLSRISGQALHVMQV